MIKKIVKGIVVGSALISMAAPVSALEVHLFGASAQYKFWTAAAPQFLADSAGANCVDTGGVNYYATKGYATPQFKSRDTGVAIGNNCLGSGEQVVISYTTFASVEGIRAVKNNVNDPDACGDNALRGVPDWNDKDGDSSSVSGGTPYLSASSVGSAGSVNDLVCDDIHIGASDVAGDTFGQRSEGAALGPLGGDPLDLEVLPESTDNLLSCRPIIVPFAFFGDQNLPTDNMTRLMATSIFSGNVTNWSDFGYASQDITVCLRHAGSGTHATLAAGVMRGDAPLLVKEALPGSFPVSQGWTPVTYFNKGSSDMMRCIQSVGAGAVGYADSDKNGAAADGSEGDYQTVKRLTYMGADGNRANVVNGVYDFWSSQWLYYHNAENAAVTDVIEKLCEYAADPTKIPASKAGFWAAEDEMRVQKATDFEWPSRI